LSLRVIANYRAKVEEWAEQAGVKVRPDGYMLFGKEPSGSAPMKPNMITEQFLSSHQTAFPRSAAFHGDITDRNRGGAGELTPPVIDVVAVEADDTDLLRSISRTQLGATV
jgi:hypothetical protein